MRNRSLQTRSLRRSLYGTGTCPGCVLFTEALAQHSVHVVSMIGESGARHMGVGDVSCGPGNRTDKILLREMYFR